MSTNQTLCSETIIPAPFQAGAIMSAVATATLRAACTVQAWRARARQRQVLATLDDRMLKDIGINRMTARREVAKPFWRP
jgi:uncharacterized protein YjiS (DUF1127 family)